MGLGGTKMTRREDIRARLILVRQGGGGTVMDEMHKPIVKREDSMQVNHTRLIWV